MKNLFKYLVSIFLSLCIVGATISEEKPVQTQQIIKMDNIKQTLIGLEKEYNAGELIKIKTSPLPLSTNLITAIYKFSLLENGKVSQNCEVLTKSESNSAPKKSGSDFIFTAKCGGGIKYQVLFSVIYIETKAGTPEIVDTYSPEIQVYDVKISGVQPPSPDNPDVPPGNYGMIRVVYLECQKLSLDKATKAKLYINMRNAFSGMSTKIAAGVYKDSDNEAEQADNINRFLKDSKEATSSAFEQSGVDKSKFDGNIDIAVKSKMEELFSSGKLRRFSEYQSLWAEISQGFDLATKGL